MNGTTPSPYDDLPKTAANHAVLSPLVFLERAARVYPDYVASIHGDWRLTWAETFARARRLASALRRRGIGRNDTVAVLLNNTPEMFECHFGVPASGAVLNAINFRLDAAAVAFILDHADARLVIVDGEFAATMKQALALSGRRVPVVDVTDPRAGETGGPIGDIGYEAFLAEGDPEFPWELPDDEWRAITLNYTSGTTGNPKGVVYHHRGAYINALGNAVGIDIPRHPVYLWTLPMFHCNGWCFPWTVAALAGTNICLRKVSGPAIYDAVAEHRVSLFCGAPIVLNFVINTPPEQRRAFGHACKVLCAAAPPPAATLENMQKAGFQVMHIYGLTETYGPATLCAWKSEWDALPVEAQTVQKGRQGVPYEVLHGLEVIDPETMDPVPADGETMGEAMFRGNIVMKGYLKNPTATDEAFRGGWFHSGDLGVMQPDRYVKLKDRAKDIIISGGENISSIEVEDTLSRHPAIFSAAVVGRQDDVWGEVPVAYVELLPDHIGRVTADDIVAFCRDRLAHFKCPREVFFAPLPRTSTGKIQKFRLRAGDAADGPDDNAP